MQLNSVRLRGLARPSTSVRRLGNWPRRLWTFDNNSRLGHAFGFFLALARALRLVYVFSFFSFPAFFPLSDLTISAQEHDDDGVEGEEEDGMRHKAATYISCLV
jgi:hypothetical protein